MCLASLLPPSALLQPPALPTTCLPPITCLHRVTSLSCRQMCSSLTSVAILKQKNAVPSPLVSTLSPMVDAHRVLTCPSTSQVLPRVTCPPLCGPPSQTQTQLPSSTLAPANESSSPCPPDQFPPSPHNPKGFFCRQPRVCQKADLAECTRP